MRRKFESKICVELLFFGFGWGCNRLDKIAQRDIRIHIDYLRDELRSGRYGTPLKPGQE